MTERTDRPVVCGPRRVALDHRVEAALDTVEEDGLALARTVVRESPDRWYGQLLALVHDAVAAVPAPERVLPAATAMELLEGYARLRSELLVQLNETVAHSFTRAPREALLAGDYLNAAAYATLSDLSHPDLDDAVETIASVSESVTGAFGVGDERPDARDVLADTAGALGAGAARLGTTLAGVDGQRRARLVRAGRGASIARRVESPGQDGGTPTVLPTPSDERRLRRYATRERAAAERALTRLGPDADAAALRTAALGRGDR
ncbi:hypothetical protein [Halolamina salifodinae]|uniref:Polyprenyl synthetase n=1 Tax=Halolamina salifodinae TaxID=1202767 RepID=A0A8T4GV80_9EURY|nr:hypothetical protein [Halolamina salifodinae]MBP1986320.1 hypothetical protein [Halolamina salifodinae]